MPVAEFSRISATDRLPPDGQDFAILANQAECAALARRLDLAAIDELRAQGRLARRAADGVIEIKGTLSASLTQRCVVTLEPIAVELLTEFVRLFSADATLVQAEIEIDPAAELIEPLEGDLVDLGEIVTEELSLALDPYPRSVEGMPADLADEAGRDDLEGPFAALAAAVRRH